MSEFGGEEPDTFEGRLAGIAQLIDTFGMETNTDRIIRRRLTIIRLLEGLRETVLDRIDAQFDRLDAE
jgi:hypothetical protein